MEYTKEFLNKVAKAHRDQGLTVRMQTRKGKQYFTISNRGLRHRSVTFWSSHNKVSEHVKSIFPRAYVTSGSWGGNQFDVTYRINP